jgi:hypothetical protein
MRVMAWMRAGLLSVSLQRRAGARPGPPRAGARAGEAAERVAYIIKSRGDLCQEPIAPFNGVKPSIYKITPDDMPAGAPEPWRSGARPHRSQDKHPPLVYTITKAVMRGAAAAAALGPRPHGGLRTSRRPAGTPKAALDGAVTRSFGTGGGSGTGACSPMRMRWASPRPRCLPAGQLTLGGGGTNSRPPSSRRQRPPSHGSRLRVAPPRGWAGRQAGCGGR